MSALARTALRLAAVEALKADPVITALCAGRVYDSRIEELDQSEPVPVIVVLTEEMEGEAWSANNGGPPFDDRCELLIELAMRAAVQVDEETAVIDAPETDSELEAQLDLLEHRAVHAVTIGDTAQTALVRQVTRRVTRQRSARFVEAETGVKLAVRMVHLTMHLKGDDAPATVIPDPQVAATPGANNAGNGTLTIADPPSDIGVELGTYAISFTDPVHFTVTDPRGNVDLWVLGQPYVAGPHFTIEPGATAFVAGDTFSLVVSEGPFAGLPEPLRTVAKAMPQGSAGASVCAQLAAALSPPAAPPWFTGIDETVIAATVLDPNTPPIPPGLTGAGPPIGDTVTI